MNKIQKLLSVPILAISLAVPQGTKAIQPVVNSIKPIIPAVYEKMPQDALKLNYFCPESRRVAAISKVFRNLAGKLGVQTFPGSEKLSSPFKRNPNELLGDYLSKFSKKLATIANENEAVFLTCSSANRTPGVKCMSEKEFLRITKKL